VRQKAGTTPPFRALETIGVLLSTIRFTQKEAVFEQLNKEVVVRASAGCLQTITASTTPKLSTQSSHEQKMLGILKGGLRGQADSKT
jgi:hypothetical protein